jgi:hypothetical protein
VALGEGEQEVVDVRARRRELGEDTGAGQRCELAEEHVPRRDAVPGEPGADGAAAGAGGETGEREPLADDRADGERVVGLAHAGGVDERDGVA